MKHIIKTTGNVTQPATGNNNQRMQVHNLLIIDESGSMYTLRESTINGVNKVLDTIRKAQADFADSQDHFVTIVTFNTSSTRQLSTIVNDSPIANVQPFADYNPDGCTPLFDAVGLSLLRLEKQIDGTDMATATVTIVTDGLENSSTEFTAQQVKELIERLTAKGWAFSYIGACHDVEKVATSLSISNAMEFAHNQSGSTASWRRESGGKMAHFNRISKLAFLSQSERAECLRHFNEEYYSSRITPQYITQLKPDEVFVFGSNVYGRHNGGAAGLAVQQFGAVPGQAEGRQGNAYAIPTTDGIDPLPLRKVEAAVSRFVHYATNHPDEHFLVTAVGCGNAGLTSQQVAPMFRDAIACENVALPIEFWNVLGIKPTR